MSLDAEMSLMAALLMDQGAVHRADVLPEQFVDQRHAMILKAINEADGRGEARDPVTLSDTLPKGLQSYVLALTQEFYSPASVEAYANTVREKWKVRQARVIAHDLGEAGDESAIDTAIRDLMALSASRRKASYNVKEMLKVAHSDLESVWRNKGKLPGVPTGLTRLDTILGGLHRQDLTVVGARPAVGKTAFLLNICTKAAVPVGIISAEQGVSQIGQRLLSIVGGVSAERGRRGNLDDQDWARLSAAAHALVETPIYVFDKPAPTIADVVRQCRAWVHVDGVKALYVDYLQRIKAEGDRPKHERVGDVAQALKEIARDLNVPVVALAQVSRAVESREDKRPRMGDLADSSEIEKEADQILTLYRDEVYHPESEHRGTAEIIIEKNRHGPTGFVRCAWLGESLRFVDLARDAA